MEGEKLYDGDGVRGEDQQTIQNSHKVATGGTRSGRGIPQTEGSIGESLLDNPAVSGEEVQASEERKTERKRVEALQGKVRPCPKCGSQDRDKYGKCIPCRRANQRKYHHKSEKRKSRLRLKEWRRQGVIGASEKIYQELLAKQGGACLCGRTVNDDGRRLGLDHDKTSGKPRAVLCFACNPMLELLVSGDRKQAMIGLNYFRSALPDRSTLYKLLSDLFGTTNFGIPVNDN